MNCNTIARPFLFGAAVALFATTSAVADCTAVSPAPGQTFLGNGSHYVFIPSADQLAGGYVAGGGCRFKDSSFSGNWPHVEGGRVTGWECEGNGPQTGTPAAVTLGNSGGLAGIWALVCRM